MHQIKITKRGMMCLKWKNHFVVLWTQWSRDFKHRKTTRLDVWEVTSKKWMQWIWNRCFKTPSTNVCCDFFANKWRDIHWRHAFPLSMIFPNVKYLHHLHPLLEFSQRNIRKQMMVSTIFHSIGQKERFLGVTVISFQMKSMIQAHVKFWDRGRCLEKAWNEHFTDCVHGEM